MERLLNIKPMSWLKIALYAVLLLGIYFSTLTWLVTKDWERESYSYCYLIPFVVLYLIWSKKDEYAALPAMPSWKGLVPILLGTVMFWIGNLGGEFLTLYISLWLILVGIIWMHIGWHKIKTIAFALFFMLTMFPVPHFIHDKVTLKLKLISSKLGVAMIQLYGMPAYREGNVIDLGFTRLQVVDACSGLNSLISLLVLSLLLVYFFRAHIWKRLFLFFSAIPLAILTNSMRITLTSILFKYFGQKAAEGFFHGFSGLLIFVFCLPVLFLEMKILSKLPPVPDELPAERERSENSQGMVDETVTDPNRHDNAANSLNANPQFITVILLLVVTLALSQGIEFQEKIPLAKPFNQFPLEVGEWAGVSTPMEQVYIDTLDLSDYAIIDYHSKSGKPVNFYVAYYESQSKGAAIHSPTTCLPGGGWSFEKSGAVTFPISSGDRKQMTVNSALMQKGRSKQLAYYWFDQRGRILTSAYQLKLYAVWDSIIQQRTDGALVRIITPVHELEKVALAHARLQKFTRDIAGGLEEFIPGKELE